MTFFSKHGALRWGSIAVTLALTAGLPLCQAAAAADALPANLVEKAQAYALSLVGGHKMSGSVTILGVNGGHELEALRAAWRPFEEATGIRIDYNATTDFHAVLQTRVAAADPPDLASFNSINAVHRYMKRGDLKDLNQLIGKDAIEGHFDPGLLATVSDDKGLYGLWTELSGNVLWYNAHLYDGPTEHVTAEQFDAWTKKFSKTGTAPWCYADERGPASGYVGLTWIETYLLKHYGPDVVNELSTGKRAWSSDEVRAAFEAYGKLVEDPSMVAGGAIAAMSTPAIRIGAGLFSDPPQCAVMQWGVFAGGLTTVIYPKIQMIEDLNFMPVPSEPQYAKYETYGGTVTMAFKDTPQVRAFLKYLASTDGQRLVAAGGIWNVSNTDIGADAYSNPVLSKVRSTLLTKDTTLVALPHQVADASVVQAAIRGVVNYAMDPSTLDQVLSSIDDAAASSKG